MQRPLNLYHGLFLLAVLFKLRGWEPSLSWFNVFFPLILDGVHTLARRWLHYMKADDKIEFFLWKIYARVKTRRAAKKARREMSAADKSGNPGKFYDTKKGQHL